MIIPKTSTFYKTKHNFSGHVPPFNNDYSDNNQQRPEKIKLVVQVKALPIDKLINSSLDQYSIAQRRLKNANSELKALKELKAQKQASKSYTKQVRRFFGEQVYEESKKIEALTFLLNLLNKAQENGEKIFPIGVEAKIAEDDDPNYYEE